MESFCTKGLEPPSEGRLQFGFGQACVSVNSLKRIDRFRLSLPSLSMTRDESAPPVRGVTAQCNGPGENSSRTAEEPRWLIGSLHSSRPPNRLRRHGMISRATLDVGRRLDSGNPSDGSTSWPSLSRTTTNVDTCENECGHVCEGIPFESHLPAV